MQREGSRVVLVDGTITLNLNLENVEQIAALRE